ncbi:LamG-like jellyroll fold domain-containing protein [Pontibacter rugosus]
MAVREGYSNTTKLYVDGELLDQKTIAYTYGFSSNAPVNIGYLDRDNGYHYEGDLDEIKLFGTALTAEDIAERYQNIRAALTELLLFEGRAKGGSVLLDWETIAEVNCKDFIIARSVNAEDFIAIGTVAASGTTQDRVHYSFTDVTALKGVSYYRLRINKTDGNYTYSNIIQVNNQTLSASSFIVYPNPIVEGDVTIQVTNLLPEEEVVIRMFEIGGKAIQQDKAVVDAYGMLNFKMPVDSNLRAGIYLLNVITSKKSLSRKMVLVR